MKINRTELFSLVAMVLAVVGVILNNNQLTSCFWVWMASNTMCAVIHLRSKLWTMAIRDVIFIGLAIHGLIMWSQ